MPKAITDSRAVHVVLAVLVAIVTAACGGGASPSASAAASAGPPGSPWASPSASASAPGLPDGVHEVRPSSPPRSVGDAEMVTVFTHCGFEGRLDWAGSLWREVGRVPAGGVIGDPEDSGRITLIAATRAVFESSTGTEVLLERLPGPAVLTPCD